MITIVIVAFISMSAGRIALVVDNMLRKVHRVGAVTIVSETFRRIRRHTTPTAVWENTVSATSKNTFFDTQPTVYIGRHHKDKVDLDSTEITDDKPSSGRHSVDNPYRQTVTQEFEEIRWSDGSRSFRPLWIPVIGQMRITMLTSNTSAYAIIRKPLTRFSNLTRMELPTSGNVRDSYYTFTT